VPANEQIERLTMAKAESAGALTEGEFEVFYLRTANALYGYLARLSRDVGTAEEVLQEAYIRIINAPYGPEPAQGLPVQNRNKHSARPLAQTEP
jgi:DNA-directed RNA polymerase specialized sigma24 family protein